MKPGLTLLHDETSKVIDAAVVGASCLRIEAEVIPTGPNSAVITVRSVQCSSDKVIIQDANAEVYTDIDRGSQRRSVCTAVAMEMDEIYRMCMPTRPEHLQSAP